jgi:hypothetical protein
MFQSTILLLGISLAAADAKTLTYSKEDAGKVPAGWKEAKTGTGDGSVWRVVADDTGPGKTGYVLMQTAEGPNRMFNLCVLDDSKYKDVDLEVSFKAMKGKLDQGGGLVWRYRDADNYYIARMNPLEDNFRVYKVVNGKRIQLETKEKIKIPAGEWHKIRIVQKGEQIECYLDGKKELEAKDDTFKDAGKIGLWSKADAQTRFDALKIISGDK